MDIALLSGLVHCAHVICVGLEETDMAVTVTVTSL